MKVVTHRIVSKIMNEDINTLLAYNPEEPYSVFVYLSEDNIWEISREVLMECLVNRSAGFLNVTLDSDGETVTMHLTSEEGSVMVHMPHSELTSFIHKSYDEVPQNKEEDFLDLDNRIQDFWSEQNAS
jgi:hypothetical protein